MLFATIILYLQYNSKTEIMDNNLVTIRTYSLMKGVTTECVRKWVKQGKVKNKVIDGVNFIKLTEEELKLLNKK